MSEPETQPFEQRWPVTPFIKWIMEQDGDEVVCDLEYSFILDRYDEPYYCNNVLTPPERFGDNYKDSPLFHYLSVSYRWDKDIYLGQVQEFLESLYGHGFL